MPRPVAPSAPRAALRHGKDARSPTKPWSSRIDWATPLRRVWDLGVLRCPARDGRMHRIAAVEERTAIVKILAHLGVSTDVPRMTRPRDGPWT